MYKLYNIVVHRDTSFICRVRARWWKLCVKLHDNILDIGRNNLHNFLGSITYLVFLWNFGFGRNFPYPPHIASCLHALSCLYGTCPYLISSINGLIFWQGHSTGGYESTDDSFEEAAGDSGKDEHTVETEESGEKDTVYNDSGHMESVYENDASGASASRSVNAKKDARRSFEKGKVILLNMIWLFYMTICCRKYYL